MYVFTENRLSFFRLVVSLFSLRNVKIARIDRRKLKKVHTKKLDEAGQKHWCERRRWNSVDHGVEFGQNPMFPKVGVTVVRLAQVNQELENAELEEEVLGSEKLSAKAA